MSAKDLALLKQFDKKLHDKWLEMKKVIDSTTYYEIETYTTGTGDSETEHTRRIAHKGTEFSKQLEKNIGDCLSIKRHTHKNDDGSITMESEYDKYLMTVSAYSTMFSVDEAKNYGGRKLVTCNGLFDKIRNEKSTYFRRYTYEQMTQLVESTDRASVYNSEESTMQRWGDVMSSKIMAKSMLDMIHQDRKTFNILDFDSTILN